MPATLPPLEDALTLTDAEVAAIIPDARQAAEDAQTAYAAAVADPASVTPTEFAERRAAAEHSELLVSVAEERWAAINDARVQAQRIEARTQILADAPSDLTRANDLTTKLDAVTTSLRAFLDAVQAHNGRVDDWGQQMRNAGLGTGPEENALTIGGKTWRHLEGGRLVRSAVYRAVIGYPEELLRDGGYLITHEGDPYGRQRMGERGSFFIETDLDLHDLIRRDA
ncbi:hypothetical protein [Streptomyces sp. NPDC002547]